MSITDLGHHDYVISDSRSVEADSIGVMGEESEGSWASRFISSPHLKCSAIVILLALAWFFPLLQGKSYSAVPGYRNAVFPWAATNNGNQFFPQSDQPSLSLPLQSELSLAVKSGTIPLWNPNSFGGQPLFSDGSSAVAYPPKLILADTVSPTTAHNVLSLLHVTLAGLFTYWLLIDLEVSPLAALFGAVAWMFGSFTLAWLQLEVVAPLFTWFPAGLATIRRAVTHSWLWVAISAGSIAMLFISTHLLFADICMVTICAYGGLLALSFLRRHWKLGERWTALLPSMRGGSAVALGVGLASVVLIPTAYALKDISRQPLTFAQITKIFVLWPPDLKYIVLPPALPISDPKMEWGMAFVGTLTALFAVVGLFLRRKGSGLGRGLMIGAFIVAVGGPAGWLAYRFVPGMNVFRPYSRLLFVFDMGLAVLGAVGLDATVKKIAGSGSADSSMSFRHSRKPETSQSRRWWLSRAFALLVVAVTAFQLGNYGRHINPPFLPSSGNLILSETPLIHALRVPNGGVAGWPNRVLPANDSTNGWQPPMLDSNVSLMFGLASAGGYESSTPTRTVDLWRVVAGEDPNEVVSTKLPGAFQPRFDASSVRFDLLPRLGVDQIALTPAAAGLPVATSELGRLGWKLTYSGNDGSVFRWSGPPTGPVVVFNATVVTGDRQALEEFARPGFDYRVSVVLNGRRSGTLTTPGEATVVSAKEGTNFASIATKSSHAGILVIPEMWDRGWSADVNGKPIPVLRANFNQQAVHIPAGPATVTLKFRPVGFVKGLVVTSISLLIFLGIGLWAVWRAWLAPRRSRSQPNSPESRASR